MMNYSLAFLLIGIAFVIGIVVARFLFTTRAGIVAIDSYDCASRTVTLIVSGTVGTIFVDALDSSTTSVSPDRPGPNAVGKKGSGTVTVGPLTHENGANNVLICVWTVEKRDSKSFNCAVALPT